MNKYLSSSIVVCACVFLLAGCSGIRPQPFSDQEMAQKVAADLDVLYKDQEQVTGPITLYEAMARAVKYNLDHRLQLMEAALGRYRLSSEKLNLLPKLAYDAGWSGRDEYSGTSSRSLITGEESLAVSTSQEKEIATFDLGLSWNILDFGVSYVRTQQAADQALILEEHRRKVVHNIIQDVRQAFWRAVSAERLLERIEPLTGRIENALEKAREVGKRRLTNPAQSLAYRRDLLQLLRQMESLRRELITAKTKLAALMNLPLGTEFSLDPGDEFGHLPKITSDLKSMEMYALNHRPEMAEEFYQERISHKEVVRQILRTLPGIELYGGWNYDSNSFNYVSNWWDWGGTITGNLLDVFTAPIRIDTAKAQVEVVRTRRMALSMAVMSQVRISWLRYEQALREYGLAAELHDVVGGLLQQSRAAGATQATGELTVIKKEADAVVTELIRDNAFSDLYAAVGRVYVSLGSDPLPATISDHDLKTLTDALHLRFSKWMEGPIHLDESTSQTTQINQDKEVSLCGLHFDRWIKEQANLEESTSTRPATQAKEATL